MFRIAVLVVAILAGGCASTYVPTERTLALRAQLNAEAAATALTRYLNRSRTSAGLCHITGVTFDKGSAVTVTPVSYSLTAYKRGELIGKKEQQTGTLYTYKKVFYPLSARFAEITEIRVLPHNAPGGQCEFINDTHEVNLRYSIADIHIVSVPAAGLDEFMAALTRVAPQAKLLYGAGL